MDTDKSPCPAPNGAGLAGDAQFTAILSEASQLIRERRQQLVREQLEKFRPPTESEVLSPQDFRFFTQSNEDAPRYTVGEDGVTARVCKSEPACYKVDEVAPAWVTALSLPLSYTPPPPELKLPKTVQCAEYLEPLFNPVTLKKVIDKLVAMIQDSGVEFDTIAFRGLSGSLVAPAVALALTKYMVAIRKEDLAECHSHTTYEGYAFPERYIIIDDLICSGATLIAIRDEVRKWRGKDAELAGVFLYQSTARPERPRTFTHYATDWTTLVWEFDAKSL